MSDRHHASAVAVGSKRERLEVGDGQTTARYIAREVLPANPGGFTIDPRRLVVPDFGEEEYIVSLRGFEERFAGLPSEAEVLRWIRRHERVLRRPGTFVGGWQDPETGLFYLDVSISVWGLERARHFGMRNGQRSIYRPATGETVWLLESQSPTVDPTDGASGVALARAGESESLAHVNLQTDRPSEIGGALPDRVV